MKLLSNLCMQVIRAFICEMSVVETFKFRVPVSLFLFVTFLIEYSGSTQKISYSGFKVIQTNPRTNEQHWLISRLEHIGKVKVLGVSKNQGPRSVVALVAPQRWTEVQDLLVKHGLRYYIIVQDFQKHIDSSINPQKRQRNQARKHTRKRRARRAPGDPKHKLALDRYHTTAEIETFISKLPIDFLGLIRVKMYGKSSEGRILKAVHIGSELRSPNGGTLKPVIMVDAGIHAREWITISSALCLISHIAANYQTDPFLQQFHWLIVPVVNPDGYDFSWQTDRLWRKTRSKPFLNLSIPDNYPHECWGVDPNRNWGNHWGEKGVQRFNVCSEVFAGPYPFSEPEVAALSDLVELYRERILLYVSMHAFSQVILAPFGYKNQESPDFHRHMSIMRSGANAIKTSSGMLYKFGSVYNTMYAASGSSIDYIYESLGVANAFVIELRDTGKYGFVLPQSEIIPTGQDSIQAILAMTAEASRHPLKRKHR